MATGICKECKNHAVLHGEGRCKPCDAKFLEEVRDYLKGLEANLAETLQRVEEMKITRRECQDILRRAANEKRMVA